MLVQEELGGKTSSSGIYSFNVFLVPVFHLDVADTFLSR
jgi:hypothetical protein